MREMLLPVLLRDTILTSVATTASCEQSGSGSCSATPSTICRCCLPRPHASAESMA
jgi:hypothetical protein